MFDLDLNEIEDVSSGLAIGDHLLTVTAAELKETKNKDGMYIKVEFTAENKQKHWEMFNIQNKNPKAQQIGLSQLKLFLKSAGFQGTKLNDVNAMLGLKVVATIKHTTSAEYGVQSRVKSYKQVVGAQKIAGSDPFV